MIGWWLLVFAAIATVHVNASKPHIIFIVADDLGWSDVSWHNPAIKTPNLEKLAREGVILNQSYVLPVCTPSRAAFMTGYYPYRTGRQNSYIQVLQPTGVSLKFPFISQKLKTLGYSTHIVGKWHLGYCNWSYTPTHRGFDSFFGYYVGSEDYYKHTQGLYDFKKSKKLGTKNDEIGLDFRNNTSPEWNYNGTYSTYAFSKAAREVLMQSDPKKPLFLYLPLQSVHSPLQVPKKYEDLYKNIVDEKRRTYSGMVSAMDEVVGHLVLDLKRYKFWDNVVIAFTTDNGGQTIAGGNNWPLRGNKATIWEGGTRGPAFVYARKLQKKGYINDNLFHAVDWYPTFLYLAGGRSDPGIDGINQWYTINSGNRGQRTEFVYNIYDTNGKGPRGAIREDNYKLILGDPGKPDGWIPLPGMRSHPGNTNTTVYLFDVKDDPLEKTNLATKLPKITERLKRRFRDLASRMVPADEPPLDLAGSPSFWGGAFTPGWCKAK